MSRQTAVIDIKLEYATQTLKRVLKSVRRGQALQMTYAENMMGFEAKANIGLNTYQVLSGSTSSKFWVLIPGPTPVDVIIHLDSSADPLVFDAISTPILLPGTIIDSIEARASDWSSDGYLYVFHGT